MVHCPSCGEENPPKFRLCGHCGAALAGQLPPRALRKTVTLVYVDLDYPDALAGQIDAEAQHEIKARFFGVMNTEIRRHGGRIEKFVGTAFVAGFGLPRAHEDDALRAVLAAEDMRRALIALNHELQPRYGVTLALRIGIHTGQVVAIDDHAADQKPATGDAVDTAARLQQAALANEICLGPATCRLVCEAVELEPVGPLESDSLAGQPQAWRLISARGRDAEVRHQDTPFVGRDAELAALQATYRQACDGPAARLVTVIGDAGLGKTRLLREFTDRIALGAQVLYGRCLAYGEGITFWPLVGLVRDAAGIADDDHPEAARAKLVQAAGDAEVAERLASAVGLSPRTYALHEVYWGTRKFLEALAARRPVVALVDDIQWAEPALLDLLVHLLDMSRGAPILLLASARHELLEDHPRWGEHAAAACLLLPALADDAAAQVLGNMLGHAQLPIDVTQRIVDAAEGNPLYVEQMLQMLIDGGALQLQGGQWLRSALYSDIVVPPTICALLEARLDSLERADRATLESASVIGLQFESSAVEALVPELLKPAVGKHLDLLVRRRFIRAADQEQGLANHRFHHQLVRDTAYQSLLKRERARLHIAFVGWADRVNTARGRAVEFQEILGWHLEQAHRYLGELGPLDEAGLAIGADAAGRLSSAARRTMERGDDHATASLLRRAAALLAGDEGQRLELLPTLAESLICVCDFASARAVTDEARVAAERLSNSRILASIAFVELRIRLASGDTEGWSESALATVYGAIPALERESAHMNWQRLGACLA
jgi:class 3 adenylate cyclase